MFFSISSPITDCNQITPIKITSRMFTVALFKYSSKTQPRISVGLTFQMIIGSNTNRCKFLVITESVLVECSNELNETTKNKCINKGTTSSTR